MNQIKNVTRTNYDKLLSIIPNPAIIFDKEGIIYHINNEFKDVFDIAKYSLRRGQTLENNFEKNDSLFILFNKIITNEIEEVPFKFRVKTAVFNVNISRLVIEKSVNYFLIFHDISEMERLEEMRKKFISDVTHELRTPLTSISTISEYLAFGDNQNIEDMREEAKLIYEEVKRLSSLVGDLVEISRYDARQIKNEIEIIEAREIINYLVEIFKYQAQEQKLSINSQYEDFQINGRKEDILQIGINIIGNALLYAKSMIEIKLEKENEYFKLIIEDDGIGMTKKQTKNIFNRFYRTDESRARNSGGSGLGLAIVKEIIERNEGFVTVESEVDRGTKFEITLKLNVEEE